MFKGPDCVFLNIFSTFLFWNYPKKKKPAVVKKLNKSCFFSELF